jgi:hypothetical protein
VFICVYLWLLIQVFEPWRLFASTAEPSLALVSSVGCPVALGASGAG